MQSFQHREITIRRASTQMLKETDDARALSLRIWKTMLYMRTWEQALKDHYQPPHLTRCPIHYAIGQEMLPAVIQEVKRDGDFFFCHHRNHNYWLAWTERPDMLLAELMGKEDAPNKGRAGSQEISWPEKRFHSGAILSTMIGIAAGTTWSIKMNGGDEWVYCTFGDGAADEGVFWEAMNFIALHELPITLLCENNGYATFSPQGRRQRAGISGRVLAFGIPTTRERSGISPNLSGDLVESLTYLKTQKRPHFIEHFTYRHCGHVGSHDDDAEQGYRDEREREWWAANDALGVLGQALKDAGEIREDDIAALQREFNGDFEQLWEQTAALEPATPIDFDTVASSTVQGQGCAGDNNTDVRYFELDAEL